jgi:uncharacterized damage-inducible protein DinB
MQPETLGYLLDYNIWADGIVLNAARRLSPDQLRASHHMGFGSAFDTLVHIMAAQRAWLSRCQGHSPTSLLDEGAPQDLAQLEAAWQIVHKDLDTFIAQLDDERLNSTVTYKTTRGEPYTNPLLFLILHVFNHSTEHRSQVAAMCNLAGYDTGPLDLIHYMRTVKQPGS